MAEETNDPTLGVSEYRLLYFVLDERNHGISWWTLATARRFEDSAFDCLAGF